MSTFRAGIARTVITPPVGTDLTGYAGRPSGCTGIHDDLYAKALVISDGETRAAIVSLDILCLNAEHIARIRRKAESETGIPAQNILIVSSHTHAGPATQLLRACGCADECYVNDLLILVAECVRDASRKTQPARFGHGKAHAHIAINRRSRMEKGDMQISRNPDGVTDPEVGIWAFTDQNGKPLATLFNYACHAVVLGGENLLVSGDWPGASARAIETELGGQAMFLQGCCGNINPGERGSFDVMEKVGTEVADAVLAAVPGIVLVESARIDIASKSICLPLQPPPSLSEAHRIEREMEEALERAGEFTSLALVHIYTAYRDWARTIIANKGSSAACIPFEIQCVSIDDAHIIGLPAEVFVEYALGLKKVRPNVMVAGYANGNIGYVPTCAAFNEGGYEVHDAYRLYGEQMLPPECENLILETGRELLITS